MGPFTPTVPIIPLFMAPHFWEWYDRLVTKWFTQSRTIDWQVLEYMGIATEMWPMVDFWEWNQLLSIEEPFYHDVTLEMLSTFDLVSFIPRASKPKPLSLRWWWSFTTSTSQLPINIIPYWSTSCLVLTLPLFGTALASGGTISWGWRRHCSSFSQPTGTCTKVIRIRKRLQSFFIWDYGQ